MSKFQIDEYVDKLTVYELKDKMTEVWKIPSLIIDEENILFLSSVDISVELTDYEIMASLLPEIENTFYNAFLGASPNYKKAYKAESDYYELIGILKTYSPYSEFEENSLGNRLKVTILEE